MKINICSFLGSGEEGLNLDAAERLYNYIEHLIIKQGAHNFLFGDDNKFTSLCHSIVSSAKEKYPHIMRIYVTTGNSEKLKKGRKQKPHYDAVYFCSKVIESKNDVRLQQSLEMIDKSDVCIFCYDQNEQNELATVYEYAVKTNKSIVNFKE